MKHQCSAENSLEITALINNKNSTGDATYYHTTNNFPVWQPTIIQLADILYEECHKEILLT